jgi:hypothetical protein
VRAEADPGGGVGAVGPGRGRGRLRTGAGDGDRSWSGRSPPGVGPVGRRAAGGCRRGARSGSGVRMRGLRSGEGLGSGGKVWCQDVFIFISSEMYLNPRLLLVLPARNPTVCPLDQVSVGSTSWPAVGVCSADLASDPVGSGNQHHGRNLDLERNRNENILTPAPPAPHRPHRPRGPGPLRNENILTPAPHRPPPDTGPRPPAPGPRRPPGPVAIGPAVSDPSAGVIADFASDHVRSGDRCRWRKLHQERNRNENILTPAPPAQE